MAETSKINIHTRGLRHQFVLLMVVNIWLAKIVYAKKMTCSEDQIHLDHGDKSPQHAYH